MSAPRLPQKSRAHKDLDELIEENRKNNAYMQSLANYFKPKKPRPSDEELDRQIAAMMQKKNAEQAKKRGQPLRQTALTAQHKVQVTPRRTREMDQADALDILIMLHLYAPFFYKIELELAYAYTYATPAQIALATKVVIPPLLTKALVSFPYIAVLGLSCDLGLILQHLIKTNDQVDPDPYEPVGFHLSDVPIVKRLLLPFLLFLANESVSDAELYDAAKMGGVVKVVCDAKGFTSLTIDPDLYSTATKAKIFLNMSPLKATDGSDIFIKNIQVVKSNFKKLKDHLFKPSTPVIVFTTEWNITKMPSSNIADTAGLLSMSGGRGKGRGRGTTIASAGKRR